MATCNTQLCMVTKHLFSGWNAATKQRHKSVNAHASARDGKTCHFLVLYVDLKDTYWQVSMAFNFHTDHCSVILPIIKVERQVAGVEISAKLGVNIFIENFFWQMLAIFDVG